MKAIVYKTYGPLHEALAFTDIEAPHDPGEHQVIVRVRAASINALDYRRFQMLSGSAKFMETYVLKSIGKVLGADISGVIHTVGKNVSQFKPGDEVFGVTETNQGGFAEFVCVNENNLTIKPSNISFESAAAVPMAACTALHALRKNRQIQSGDKILINGASGGVGSFAIQLAGSFGANVTAVCSTHNLEIAKSLGANDIIDYTKSDFTREKHKYDLILAVNGFHPILNYKRCLSKKGTYIAIGGEIKQIIQAIFLGPLISLFSEQKMMFMGISRLSKDNLNLLANLLYSGKIVPIVDKTFPISETVDAFKYILDKQAQGKIVLTFEV